ncbi:MAG: DNA recombination protein RmuC [Bacillota bacterium]|nr:DNA recombination protein RmuC [Bacillota bacterium]
MQFTIELILLIFSLLLNVVVIALLILKKSSNVDLTEEFENFRRINENQQSLLRQELTITTQTAMRSVGDVLQNNQKAFTESLMDSVRTLDRHLMDKHELSQNQTMDAFKQMEERFKTFSLTSEQKLNQIRESVEQRLKYLQEDNNKKLDDIKNVVDEKLQKTLQEKMTQSFSLVNERLEQVYKGLGEMQNLAVGVGDLKKVLSNVKARGVVGEFQLGAILTEILSPEQYATNVATKRGSKNVVEFAVKLPNDDNSFIYLPIDSKFPGDTYAAFRDAYESGNKDEIELAVKKLIAVIKTEAKDIRDKYIDPPNTTDFAIMFLPFEGLYSEIVNMGLVEILQRDYKVNIAGPSTMAALLNSLQMGFKTLAVQQRSTEVWNILGAVKTEFDNFEKVLTVTQQRLDQANSELDKLVGVRTRQIQKKLRAVSSNSPYPVFDDKNTTDENDIE